MQLIDYNILKERHYNATLVCLISLSTESNCNRIGDNLYVWIRVLIIHIMTRCFNTSLPILAKLNASLWNILNVFPCKILNFKILYWDFSKRKYIFFITFKEKLLNVYNNMKEHSFENSQNSFPITWEYIY